MDYRSMPKIGAKPSLLGLGCMRLPMLGMKGENNDWGKEDKIDRVKTAELIDKALAGGVTYFDTAYVYHNAESEYVVGELLCKKYARKRGEFYIATKLPSWEINSLDDAKRIFNEQLKRLQTDYIDFYLLHAVTEKGSNSFQKLRDLGVYEYCEQLKKDGKIRYFGFSFHDEYPAFEEIILRAAPSGGWDFCQIQLNYIDTEYQAGVKGAKLCEKQGIPVVIMEPLRGGALASQPDDVMRVFTDANMTTSAADIALKWVADNTSVKVILSGMTTIEQLEQNIVSLSDFKPLTKEQLDAVSRASEVIRSRRLNECTGCRYCMPCPAGVDIPINFLLWNEWGVFRMREGIQWKWINMIGDDAKAKNCIKCGKCEGDCPQGIKIRANLETLQKEFDALVAG